MNLQENDKQPNRSTDKRCKQAALKRKYKTDDYTNEMRYNLINQDSPNKRENPAMIGKGYDLD